jgi:hypothetical protein
MFCTWLWTFNEGAARRETGVTKWGIKQAKLEKHKKIQHLDMIFRLQPREPTKSST